MVRHGKSKEKGKSMFYSKTRQMAAVFLSRNESCQVAYLNLSCEKLFMRHKKVYVAGLGMDELCLQVVELLGDLFLRFDLIFCSF